VADAAAFRAAGRDGHEHLRIGALSGGLLSADETLDGEFEARVVEHSTLAFRVAYSVLRQKQDAEDVAQEALVRAHREFRRLRDRSRFKSWLVRTTWRLALDLRRGDQRRASREVSAAPVEFTSGEDAMLARDRARRLWRAIDDLPEKLRVVIVLAAIQGHDVREVADLLGLPAGTVKSRLFTAREKLKERLQ
jgi:RNA polymerase sigma-70 factor, ECF subfamily